MQSNAQQRAVSSELEWKALIVIYLTHCLVVLLPLRVVALLRNAQ